MDRKIDCSLCENYYAGICKPWNSPIPNNAVAESCSKFAPHPKAEVISQKDNAVCFIAFTEKVIDRTKGSFNHPSKIVKQKGLLLGTKIVLSNGTHRTATRSSITITKRYNGIPDWANKHLRTLYKEAKTSDELPPVKKSPRKRCNTCVHFHYGPDKSGSRYGYVCELSGKIMSGYNHLENCSAPKYKRK